MHVQGNEKEPHFLLLLLLKVCQKSIPAALLCYVPPINLLPFCVLSLFLSLVLIAPFSLLHDTLF